MAKRYNTCCFRLVPPNRRLLSVGDNRNRLTVLGEPFFCRISEWDSAQYAVCSCSCGSIAVCNLSKLKHGKLVSCGCYQREIASMRSRTHGMSRTRLYKIWHKIQIRCYDEGCDRYHDYGGRGIAVCEEWRNSFDAFHKWALANGYNESLTIDRKENDGNYEPSNCRWATNAQQQANKRHRTGTKSKFKGVHKHRGRFAVKVRGRHIGLFKTEEAAARAYDEAASREFGEFACLNFPVKEVEGAGTIAPSQSKHRNRR